MITRLLKYYKLILIFYEILSENIIGELLFNFNIVVRRALQPPSIRQIV